MKHICMFPALLVLAFPPQADAQASDAEKLFRAMEKKISEARAFKVDLRIETSGDTDHQGSFRGFLLLTKDNKARLDVSGVHFGEAMHWQMVSNGKKTMLRPYNLGVPEASKEEATLPTPKHAHDRLVRSISRLGIYPNLPRMAIMLSSDDLLQMLPIQAFKAGRVEKVGRRDARVIHYRMGPAALKEHANVTLWIDTKTLLPLKRVVSPSPAWGVAVTETYRTFTLDPEIDAGAFELAFPVSGAAKLFRATQAKIEGARAVRAAIRLEAKAGDKITTGRASLVFTNKNQARCKVEIDARSMKEVVEMISDGKRVKFAEVPGSIARAEADPVPADFSRRLTRMLASLGVMLTYPDMNGAAPAFPDGHLVSFETCAPGKLGGRNARVLTYMIAGLPGADWIATLWIDAETGLPLKRVLVPIGGKPGAITETDAITLNPKVPAERFQLPK